MISIVKPQLKMIRVYYSPSPGQHPVEALPVLQNPPPSKSLASPISRTLTCYSELGILPERGLCSQTQPEFSIVTVDIVFVHFAFESPVSNATPST